METWLTSDTHFGHTNIIRYCNRPFDDAEEMNEKLIENWNKLVGKNDRIYHLGDVYFGSKGKVLDRLNGRKTLILGNHDEVNEYLLKHFREILCWEKLRDQKLLLTHVPAHPSVLGFGADRNVHGHVHNHTIMKQVGEATEDLRYINISVEMTNYTPVHIDALKDM